jgi:hypothetical protein
MIKFVSSNWFAAKSVEQMRVEQSQFEQFTPTPFIRLFRFLHSSSNHNIFITTCEYNSTFVFMRQQFCFIFCFKSAFSWVATEKK